MDQPMADTCRPSTISKLNPALLGLLSAAAGLSVANSYYNQPMLGQVSAEFGLSVVVATLIPVLTQAGNAAGIIFLAPLGDRFERKTLILITTAVLVVSLIGAATAPSFLWLALASLCIGLFATVAQQIVPLSIHIAPPDAKGQVLGTVTGGILLGILLSRAISGTVADWWDWQVMLWIAAGAMTLVGILLALALPRVPPTTDLNYARLLGSLWTFFRRFPLLRRSVAIQALIFAAFLAFWSNIAFLLTREPFSFGPSAVGLLAIAGAGGVLAAPLAGRFADKQGSERVVLGGAAAVAVSFVIFLVAGRSLILLTVGVILMDLGVQASQVANQARVYALDPNARSRLNTIFMATMLLGGSLGAGAGGLAFSTFGWIGTSAFGLTAALLALAIAVHNPSSPNEDN